MDPPARADPALAPTGFWRQHPGRGAGPACGWEWQLGWRRAAADAVKAGVALWVRYEDLKSDLPGQVRRLQAFYLTLKLLPKE